MRWLAGLIRLVEIDVVIIAKNVEEDPEHLLRRNHSPPSLVAASKWNHLSAVHSLTLPTLAFFEKQRVFPQKARVFSLRGTRKILGKERKNAQKSKENQKTKKKKQGKSKKARIGGSGLLRSLTIRKGFLRKFGGKFAEKKRFLRQERVRKLSGKYAEISPRHL